MIVIASHGKVFGPFDEKEAQDFKVTLDRFGHQYQTAHLSDPSEVEIDLSHIVGSGKITPHVATRLASLTESEKLAIVNEDGVAGNIGDLDLSGTHYIEDDVYFL